MANLYRHKVNHQLYTIEHLVLDIRYTNRNGLSGIYATPYLSQGMIISHTRENEEDNYNPKQFVEDNFDIVSENI